MARTQRLSMATLGSLRACVARPKYVREAASVGQVHLGVGAFMRAHVACYNDEAMNVSGGNWGIAGVSLRQPHVREQLEPQDRLYNVVVCGSAQERYRLIGSIKSIDVAPEDPHKVIQMIADPAVRVISLTVTEKGYSIEPESGALDRSSADIIHDLSNPVDPRTTLGFLAAGLRLRRDNDAGAVTLLSCDNLPHNGERLRGALSEFIDDASPDLIQWLEKNCRFPSTMVDRIVPATTAADIERTVAAIGLQDAAMVRTEPFSQWVIEDDFSAGRPDWESAGALLVENVEPYELAKLRLLNGAHSALAYLGYLGGYKYVHELMQNSRIVAYVRYLMEQEISPVSPQPAGMDHGSYIEELLTRFGNTALRHRTWQIAMDGSQKLPQRLLDTARAQLKKGGPVTGLALAIAAWIRYTQGLDEQGGRIDVRDPLVDRFRRIAARSSGDPEDLVSRYLAITEVFGSDLATQPRFVSMLARQLRQLMQSGATQTLSDFFVRSGLR